MIVLVQKDLTFAVSLTTSSSNIDEKSSVFLRLMKLQNNLSWTFHFKTQVIFGKKLNTGIYMHLLFFSVYIILQSTISHRGLFKALSNICDEAFLMTKILQTLKQKFISWYPLNWFQHMML